MNKVDVGDDILHIKRKRTTTFFVIFMFLLMLSCVSTRQQRILEPGDHRFSLSVDERRRSYLVHVPSQAEEGTALPVVLCLHGGGGSAEGFQAYTQMDATADHHGFLAVYPQGTGKLRNKLLTWNAGQCCGYALEEDVDDVAYVAALLDDLARRTPVDTARVYATGLSNGAMMSYRLAAQLPDRMAAVAPVAGAPLLETLSPTQAVPVMHIHSTEDARAFYDGGIGPEVPWTDRRIEHPAVADLLAFWAELNGCRSEPEIAAELTGEAGTENADQTATKYVYGPCREDAEVIHWKLTGVGHVWPGASHESDFQDVLLGAPTTLIEANEEIWTFFSRHSLE